MDRPHSVSVAGVVVDAQGRALLIQRRDNGKWEPPGGVLEREETLPEALQREVLEETGIKIALPATLTGGGGRGCSPELVHPIRHTHIDA